MNDIMGKSKKKKTAYTDSSTALGMTSIEYQESMICSRLSAFVANPKTVSKYPSLWLLRWAKWTNFFNEWCW